MDRETGKQSPLTPKEARMIHDLYQYAFFNNVNAARSLVESLSPELRQKLTRQHDGMLLDPPMIAAIYHQNVAMVKFLLDECKSDINELIRLKVSEVFRRGSSENVFPNETMFSITPVEYAACTKATEVVKLLVSRGADTTRFRQEAKDSLISPVTATTFEVTRFFLDGGTDVNSSTSDGVTALMRAAALDFRACQLLIERGAEVNSVSNSGQTALHAAAKANDPQTVRLLLESGADPFHQDGDGIDSFRIACFCDYEETLKVLCTEVSAHADEPQRQQIEKYLRLASLRKLRRTFAEDPDLGFDQYFQPDLDQGAKFEALKRDLQEGLELTREILGPEHPWFCSTSLETALCYLNTGYHNQWLSQLVYNIQVTQSSNLDTQRRCQELGRINDQMREGISQISDIISPDGADVGPLLGFDVFYELLKTVAIEAANCSPPDEIDKLQDFISLLLDLVSFVDFDNNQKQGLYSLMRLVVKLGLRSTTGKTLLMLSTDKCASFSSTPLNVVTMLLECGADASDRDYDGNNVVHLLLPMLPVYANIARRLARTFLEYGVHLDARNNEGVTTFWCLKHKFGIEVDMPVNLMCLAARAVRRYNIPFAGEIPKSLIDFVKMH